MPELIITINPSHERIVKEDGLRARNTPACTISHLPLHSCCYSWVGVGDNNHWAIVLPHGDSNVLVLSHSILSPLTQSFLQQHLQVLREALVVATKSATTIYANPEKVNKKVYTRKKSYRSRRDGTCGEYNHIVYIKCKLHVLTCSYVANVPVLYGLAQPDRNCSMNFVRTHARCAQTRAITASFLHAFSRNRAKLRQFAREIPRELQSHFSARMAKSICTFGKKGSQASKALRHRISSVFEYL